MIKTFYSIFLKQLLKKYINDILLSHIDEIIKKDDVLEGNMILKFYEDIYADNKHKFDEFDKMFKLRHHNLNGGYYNKNTNLDGGYYNKNTNLDGGYYNKYLKYKSKYLALTNINSL